MLPLARSLRGFVPLSSCGVAAIAAAACGAPPTAPLPPAPPAPSASTTAASPPPTVASAASAAPSPPPVPKPLVACATAAPPLPTSGASPLTFAVVLDVVDRLDVFAVDGRALFGRMGKATAGSHGPGGGYLNRFYELAGGKIKPVKELQKGLWEDFYIARIEGHWPDSVTLVGTNYSNTAWEEVAFVWDDKAKAWDTKQNGARAWPGGRIVAKQSFATQRDAEIFALVPSGSALGVPDDLFANVASGSASLVVAPPRDLYALDNPCADPGGRNCEAKAVLHWCAPRKKFEAAALPDILEKGALVAVAGTALAYDADDAYQIRDGIVSKVPLPDPSPKAHRFKTSGGQIFYLGTKGLFRLEHTGFVRLFAWERTGDAEKLTIPNEAKPMVVTGISARSDVDISFTTWDEKRSKLWSTRPEKPTL